jgi:hypothetical protein
MTKLTVTTKSAAQIDAEFEALFRNVKPIEAAKPVTQAQRLAPYRKAIMKQRRRGLTWQQIADTMRQPPIAEPVPARVLRELFERREKPVLNLFSTPASRAPNPTPAPAPAAPVPRPAPRLMTPKEAERFVPLLEGLIPAIVKTRMTRSDARSYASNAVELFRPAEAERFQEVLAAELDALDQTTCSRYAVAPDLIAPWKRRWV